MKTIAIFSDTHGNKSAIKKCETILRESDMIFHAGDGNFDLSVFPDLADKVYAVDGNCDYGALGTLESVIEVEDRKILLTHGHLYGVKSNLDKLVARAKELCCDIVIYGHNHKKRVETIDGVLTINPGTLSRTCPTPSFCYLVIDREKAVATLNEKIFL